MNITRVHGGKLNRMWRFDTDDGTFAVKELTQDRDWTYRFDDIFRYERAAFDAGIPMPEPIAANDTLLVHRWVDGEKVPEVPVPPAFAREVGAIVSNITTLDIEWTHVSTDDPMPTEEVWADLARRAASQPWGTQLASLVPVFGAIGRFVDSVGRPDPNVVTHRDIGQKNLLSVDGHPVVLDWETTGMQPLACELGHVATTLACGAEFAWLEPAVFRAVLEGFVDAGGTLPEPGPHWFADHLGGWTWFVTWNIGRCLADAEPDSGPDLAVAHETVVEGLRDLPAIFRSIDRLADLTYLR